MAEFSGSVIVPAHAEANALQHLLRSILEQDLGEHHLQVVVVDNGSDDGTGEVARRWQRRFRDRGHRLSVRSLPMPSKPAALNAGDAEAVAFPRIYLDADVTLSSLALRRTIDVLRESDRPLLAAPTVRIGAVTSRVATSYGRLWSQLPYIREQVPGVGFYAVNEAGRRRWATFPLDIGADDKFARLHFRRDEACVIADAWFEIHLPSRVGELIRVRGRWTALNLELRRHHPELVRGDRGRVRASTRFVLSRPELWRDAPAFLAIWVLGYGLAGLRRIGLETTWPRARSSAVRSVAAAEPPS